MNGGMQRCFNMIHQLAKCFKVTLIINQGREDFLKAKQDYPAIAALNAYSTVDELPVMDIFNLLPGKLQNALRYRWYKKKFKGPADGLFLQYYPLLTQLLKKQTYDVIVLENLSSINAVSTIRKFDRTVKIIYDAHNVDTHLAKVEVEKGAMDAKNMFSINKVESSLYKTVNAVITCSQEDLDVFEKMNHQQLRAAVIPNGVHISKKLFDKGVQQDRPDYILFCGTLSSVSNIEGLLWFYNNCWFKVRKAFPNLKLLVLGSGTAPGSLVSLKKDLSIQFTGAVADVKEWYDKAAVAIVPLLSGSGTRLKILEAMSLGLPVVSTSKGAEGIKYTNGEDIIVADDTVDFAEAVAMLLVEKDRRLALQKAARKLVEEKYDWDVIGKSLHSFIQVIG